MSSLLARETLGWAPAMWETEVVCSACSGTHVICATIIPRAFTYACPESGTVVDLPYRDPSKTPDPWREVSERSPGAIPVEDAQSRGHLEI